MLGCYHLHCGGRACGPQASSHYSIIFHFTARKKTQLQSLTPHNGLFQSSGSPRSLPCWLDQTQRDDTHSHLSISWIPATNSNSISWLWQCSEKQFIVCPALPQPQQGPPYCRLLIKADWFFPWWAKKRWVFLFKTASNVFTHMFIIRGWICWQGCKLISSSPCSRLYKGYIVN